MIREARLALNRNPNYMFFEITSKCNAFCDFCWNWRNVTDAGKFSSKETKSLRDELSLDEIEKITKNLPEMLAVNFYGGEPFLRADLVECVSFFIENCNSKYISFATNGFASSKIVSDLTKLTSKYQDVHFAIFFSIDGPPEHHDKLRKVKGGYHRLFESIHQINELKKKNGNISLSSNSNYNNYTQKYLKNFVKQLIEMNIFDVISVNAIRGNPYDSSLLKVDLGEFYEIQKMITKYNYSSKSLITAVKKTIQQLGSKVYKKNKNAKKRIFKCYCGTKFYVMDDCGEVFACETMIDKSMGNIRNFNYNLEKLMRSESAVSIQKMIKNKRCNCNWDCAINNSLLFNWVRYPELAIYCTYNLIKTVF